MASVEASGLVAEQEAVQQRLRAAAGLNLLMEELGKLQGEAGAVAASSALDGEVGEREAEERTKEIDVLRRAVADLTAQKDEQSSRADAAAAIVAALQISCDAFQREALRACDEVAELTSDAVLAGRKEEENACKLHQEVEKLREEAERLRVSLAQTEGAVAASGGVLAALQRRDGAMELAMRAARADLVSVC